MPKIKNTSGFKRTQSFGTSRAPLQIAIITVNYLCAMKLAAPIAVLSAMKEAAGHGIIVKAVEEKKILHPEEHAKVIKALHDSGIKNCVMITGDDEGAAKNAARLTKFDHYISRALPEDKVRYIEEQKKLRHKVIMIGDGINDAPALAAADTGIAMGDCADITGETADIVLSADDGLLGLYKTRVHGSLLMDKIDKNNRNIVTVNTALMFLGLFGIKKIKEKVISL